MTQKYDLKDCAIIIPLQIDFPERREHFHFVHSYFQSHFVNHQLLIVEMGREQEIPFSHFIQTEGEFSTSIASNVGVTKIKTPYFCKFDVDAVLSPKALFDAFQWLKKDSNTSFILPYNRISYRIFSPLREQLLQAANWEDLEEMQKSPHVKVKNDQSTGLIHLFRTSVFKELGGYNEEFVGWGYEDDEIVHRFEKLNHPPQFLKEACAFHLEHPRKASSVLEYSKNWYRYSVIQNMDSESLREYIKTWSRFG